MVYSILSAGELLIVQTTEQMQERGCVSRLDFQLQNPQFNEVVESELALTLYKLQVNLLPPSTTP